MSKIYSICAEHTHEVNGEEKTTYKNVGIVKVTERGGWFLRLFHQPGVTYRVFASDDDLPVIT